MSDQTGRKEIVSWADLIRVMAIVLVVMIHVSGQLTNHWGEVPITQWVIADIYGGLARVAVPLFFMISGYLLLPRREPLVAFYTKRVLKILIPLVVWSLIYLGWYCGTHPNTCTPALAWNLFLVEGTYYHLWFLYSILNIYLILPVLRLMIRPDMDKTILWYLIGLWLVFQSIVSLASKFWDFRIKLSPPLATGFVCFLILGYLLAEVRLSHGRVLLSAALWLVSTFVTIVGTYLLTRNAGKFDGFFYDFVSLNVILASAAAFLLLRWISEIKPFNAPIMQSLARMLAGSTFGIYLIHVIVMEVLSSWIPLIQINAEMGNAIWTIPVVSLVVFLISLLIVRVIQKIPFIDHIVP